MRAFRPRGVILSGGPSSVYEPEAPLGPPGVFELGVPGARHLLRHAADGAPARRRGGEGRGPRVRARPPRDRAGRGALQGFRRQGAGARGRLDEPRRPHRAAAAGVQADRDDGELPRRRDGRPDAAFLRHPVPPRGRAHPARQRDSRQFRARDLRLLRRLGHALLRRLRDRPDPQDRRAEGQGGLRALRRRRFRRGGAARPPGDRRPAELHLRRQRRAAPRRAPGRRAHLPRPLPPEPRRRGRRGRASSGSWPASPTPSASARSSATSSSRSSRRRPGASARSTSSRRGRSTPTSSSRSRSRARRRSSRATTTWAACRSGCT